MARTNLIFGRWWAASGAVLTAAVLAAAGVTGVLPVPGTAFLAAQETLTAPERVVNIAAVTAAEMYQPTAIPDRIVLSFHEDPSTSRSINWRTSTEVTEAFVEWAPADAGPLFVRQAQRLVAKSEALTTDLSEAHFHSAVLTGLEPGAWYAYRVGDGTNWSEWLQFQTTPADQKAFSFIYVGDAQNNLRSMWSRVIRQAYRDAPEAAFILHAGDLVNRPESDGEWGEWFGAGAWLNAMTPQVAVPGNHEYLRGEDGQRRVSHHWRPSFNFPQNGPVGLEESCYTFVYNNMRFIGLDSNNRLEEQAEWLEQVLSKNESRWVVCSFHHPVYSTGKNRDNPQLRQVWKPIFDKYRVDLVLTGHDHTYGRTGFDVPPVLTMQIGDQAVPVQQAAEPENVPVGVQAVEPTFGTVYVVSVSGPKMYDHSRADFMKRKAEDTQLYQVITIDGDQLRFTAKTAIGEDYDAFELHKQAEGQPNRLVEIPVDMPERLRAAN